MCGAVGASIEGLKVVDSAKRFAQALELLNVNPDNCVSSDGAHLDAGTGVFAPQVNVGKARCFYKVCHADGGAPFCSSAAKYRTKRG